MSLARVFFNHTASAVHRVSKTNESGTLQPDLDFVTVSGMTSLEACLQPLSTSRVPTDLGIAAGEAFRIVFHVESLPSGAVIYAGDRVLIGSETYVVREANLINDGVDELWTCVAERRTG